MTKDAVIDCVHRTIYGFFDVVADDSEEPMSEKDKLLLEVNKAVCNAVKEMHDDERKTGKWIHIGGDEWVCSECGYVISTEGSWEHPKEIGEDFCQHCGAKMEGAE